jgi:hypothetical protein
MGRWLGLLAYHRCVVARDRGSDAWQDLEHRAPNEMLSHFLLACGVLEGSPRRVRGLLSENSEIAGLHQPSDGLRRVEVDVPDLVGGVIMSEANCVFQGDFDEQVSGHTSGFIDQPSWEFDVFDDMTDDG